MKRKINIEDRITNRTWRKCPLCKTMFPAKFREVCEECIDTNRYYEWRDRKWKHEADLKKQDQNLSKLSAPGVIKKDL